MKITVCELNNQPDRFIRDWEQLVIHVRETDSDMVLLPEMPFCSWFCRTNQFDPKVWESAVNDHDNWMERLGELSPAIVLGSRPVNKGSKRLNQAFVWEDADGGYRSVHAKYYVPDEKDFWEASWYHRGDGMFTPVQTRKASVGFAICTEIWFTEHLRTYGKKGVHLIANPRATRRTTIEKWVVAGRAASVISGAFCISSNLVDADDQEPNLGGQGWIIGPDGEVMGMTSRQHPFITAEIDLSEAEKAKHTYPRSVAE